MLAIRLKDPALAELDNQIAAKLAAHRRYLTKAEADPYYLKYAENAYKEMDSLLELRSRGAAKRNSSS